MALNIVASTADIPAGATVGDVYLARDPAGVDASTVYPFRALQSMNPVPGTGTMTALGCVFAGTGTLTGAVIAGTNRYAAIPRIDVLVTTAATTAVAGVRTNAAALMRGTAANAGGFNATLCGGPATGLSNATRRFFLGYRASNAAPTDVQPSSLVSMVGIGYDAADTNLQLMYNDASGTATKVDLGVARPSADRTACYALDLWCAGGDTGLQYRVMDHIASTEISAGTLTTDIPAATTPLLPLIYSSAGGTSAVTGVSFVLYGATYTFA